MSGKEMGSRRGNIEIIDANEESTVGARSKKFYSHFDKEGKPIVVEDLTSCDGRDDTVDYLGSKRFSASLSPEIGRMLGRPGGNENAVDDDEDEDDPPKEVRWATRFVGRRVDSSSESAAEHIAPPGEVRRDKIDADFTFRNSADSSFKTEELLAKLRTGEKPQTTRQADKIDFSSRNSVAIAHVDGITHRKTDDNTSASARVLQRKAVLDQGFLRGHNAALAASHGTVTHNVVRVDSFTHKSRDSSSGLAASSDDDRSEKAVRAKPGKKLGHEEANRGNDLTARSDIIHIADDQVCIDLVSNSSYTANRMEAHDEVPSRDIDPVKNSSSRTNRAEGLDQAPSKDIDLVKSSSSLSNRMEALDLVHIEIKTNTQKRADDQGVDTETENAILGEPDKKTEHDGTHYYAFGADKSEQQEEEEIRSIDIIHVDSPDDEDISMRAIGFGGYDSDDNSESAVKSEASSVERHAEIEESEENGQDMPEVEESYNEERHAEIEESKENGQDMPAVDESYNAKKKHGTPEVDEYDQDTPDVGNKHQDTPDLVGNSVGNNPATPFELMGNDQKENERGIIGVKRAEQENTESDDEPELVQLVKRKKGLVVAENVRSISEGAVHGASKLAIANDIDCGMEHNAIQFDYAEEHLKEIVQDKFKLSTANTRKKPARLDFHCDSRNVTEDETNISGGMEHHAEQLVYPEEDDLESIIAQGSFEFIEADTKRPFQSDQDDSDSGFMTASTRQKSVRVDYNDFRSVVGNSTNANVSQLVDVIDDDEEDDTNIPGPSTINTYNRDLAISDEASSESSALNEGREDVSASSVFETTPKAANISTKEVTGVDYGNLHNSENATGVDHGNFYNSEDENTAQSGSKVSMEESKCSLESDLEMDIDLEEGNDVYESFAVPFVVEMLDRSCAWFEERNNSMPCNQREPSLFDKTKKWTPPAKKSTLPSRNNTIANKKSNIPSKKPTLSRSEQAAKTFGTTAIKPQHPHQPETISIAENAMNKTLAPGPQPIEQNSRADNSSKNARPLRRRAKSPKKKVSKRRSAKAQEESDDDPDSNHFQEKIRHLWAMKRHAQKYKETQNLNEHSEDSERQSSVEKSAASAAKSFRPRFIARSMTAPTEAKPTRPDESYVGHPVAHPTKSATASSLIAKASVATEAPAIPSVSRYVSTEKEAAPARYIRRSVVHSTKASAASSPVAKAVVAAEASAMPSVSPCVVAETEGSVARSIAPEVFAEMKALSASLGAPEAFADRSVKDAPSEPAYSKRAQAPEAFADRSVKDAPSEPAYSKRAQAPEAFADRSVKDAPSEPAYSKRAQAPEAFADRSVKDAPSEPAYSKRVQAPDAPTEPAYSKRAQAPKAFADRSVKDAPSGPANSKRAQPLPEASDWHSPEQEPLVLRTTRVIRRLAGGPESKVKSSRSIVAGGPESISTHRRIEHSAALCVLEQEENNDCQQIAAAEEAIAEAFSIGYDTLNETERLDAIELANRLQRRTSALKRRRKQRQKKLMDLQDMQDMDDNVATEEEPSFI